MLRFSAHSVYNEITLANDERQKKKKRKTMNSLKVCTYRETGNVQTMERTWG